MILRASRPPLTSSAPAPSANSEAIPAPPVGGSSFFFSSFLGASFFSSFLGASFFSSFFSSFFASFFSSFFLGSGQSALATTSPALASGGTSGQPAFALAPPATASALPFSALALTSGSTAASALPSFLASATGAVCAMAAEAAATTSIAISATNNINFFNSLYLLSLQNFYNSIEEIRLNPSYPAWGRPPKGPASRSR